jgi:hypothetical protein
MAHGGAPGTFASPRRGEVHTPKPGVRAGRAEVGTHGESFPGSVLRVLEPVDLPYDIMALVLEFERRKRFPLLFFDNVHLSAALDLGPLPGRV